MSSPVPTPELLAPAGTLSSALAAYAAGADAVYCGLGRFNAREMGSNFSLDDLSRLSAKAKADGKRFYLTLNTLVKETEWEAFAETVEEAAALDPDAIILQDLGVARFLRRYYPQLELHGSTQMGIHNSRGVRAAADLGLSRVILERQVTLDELEQVVAASPLEVEVFIHGALCCSLSGNCLFSSWMGGWSGNRGRCKQPCRRRFHGVESAGPEKGKPKSGFLFSTQDLYSLGMIDRLQAMGVASLKIEGRLKQPDYVYQVVSAYRLVLDTPTEERPRVMGEARKILSSSYGRRWSRGFASGEDMEHLIQYDQLGVSGQLIGAVGPAVKGGFKLRPSRRLHLGDRLRVQPDSGEEVPSFTLTSMRSVKNRGAVQTARAGEEVVVGFDREAPRGAKVYRVGSSGRRAYPDGAKLPLYSRPRRFDLSLRIDREGVRVEVDGRVWRREEDFPAAEKHPLDKEKAAKEFGRTRIEGVAVGDCRVELEGNPFIPASRLKALRREFWDWFEAEGVPEVSPAPPVREVFLKRERRRAPRDLRITRLLDPRKRYSADSRTVSAYPLDLGKEERRIDPEAEYILPPFCPEGEYPRVKQALEKLLALGVRRVRVTSLYQLQLLKELKADSSKLELSAAYPLPTANSLAAETLAEFGVARVQGWLELERSALEALRDAGPLPVEIYGYGRPALLVTRARIPIEGEISDSRGGRFYVSGRDELGLTHLYPAKPMEIPDLPGSARCIDLLHAEPDEEETESFNFDRELV